MAKNTETKGQYQLSPELGKLYRLKSRNKTDYRFGKWIMPYVISKSRFSQKSPASKWEPWDEWEIWVLTVINEEPRTDTVLYFSNEQFSKLWEKAF